MPPGWKLGLGALRLHQLKTLGWVDISRMYMQGSLVIHRRVKRLTSSFTGLTFSTGVSYLRSESGALQRIKSLAIPPHCRLQCCARFGDRAPWLVETTLLRRHLQQRTELCRTLVSRLFCRWRCGRLPRRPWPRHRARRLAGRWCATRPAPSAPGFSAARPGCPRRSAANIKTNMAIIAPQPGRPGNGS